MGISKYGYDWNYPYKKGTKAKVITNTKEIDIAREYGAVIQYDEASQAPYFYYTDETGQQHIVWFEDARSIEARLMLVNKYNLGGVFYWTVMYPFPQNWVVLNAMYDVNKLL